MALEEAPRVLQTWVWEVSVPQVTMVNPSRFLMNYDNYVLLELTKSEIRSLPKIDTSISSLDLGGMMPRSAGMLSSTFDDLEGFLFGNTVNPAALHFNMSPLDQPIGSPTSPFGHSYSGVDSTYYSVDDGDDDSEWMYMLGPGMMAEPAGQSSPSAFSTTSGGAISEVVLSEPIWQTHHSGMPFPDFRTPNFNDTPPPGTIPCNPSVYSRVEI